MCHSVLHVIKLCLCRPHKENKSGKVRIGLAHRGFRTNFQDCNVKGKYNNYSNNRQT